MIRTPPNNPAGKICIRDSASFAEHRAGWAYCMAAIEALHNENGVLLDDFIEQRFSWDYDKNVSNGVIPYRKPWVGFFHNPPGIPAWYLPDDAPQRILERPAMQESLAFCKGLFVLSEYHRDWLADRVDVMVDAVVHPTEFVDSTFSMERFEQNPEKAVLQIGVWLRSLTSLASLGVSRLGRTWLITSERALEYHALECEHLGLDPMESRLGGVEERFWVDHSEYDDLLTRNIVFANLFDSSANNLVVECIVRHTPLLVNPLPAVVEYLGRDYPFYFSTLAEAAAKAEDFDCVRRTHEYLKAMDKRRFSAIAFRASIMNSRVYRSLPTPTGPGAFETSLPARIESFSDTSLDTIMRHVREQMEGGLADELGAAHADLSLEDRVLRCLRDELLRDKVTGNH